MMKQVFYDEDNHDHDIGHHGACNSNGLMLLCVARSYDGFVFNILRAFFWYTFFWYTFFLVHIFGLNMFQDHPVDLLSKSTSPQKPGVNFHDL